MNVECILTIIIRCPFAFRRKLVLHITEEYFDTGHFVISKKIIPAAKILNFGM